MEVIYEMSYNLPQQMSSSLFPAYSCTIKGEDKKDLSEGDTEKKVPILPAQSTSASSWLENVSFKSTDAVTIQQIYKKQTIDSSSAQTEAPDSSKTKSDVHRVQGEARHSKRSYVSSDQSSEDEHDKLESSYHKKHKNKKKKKKKKKDKKEKRISNVVTEYQGSPLRAELVRPADTAMPAGTVFCDSISDITYRVDKTSDQGNYTYQSIYKMNIASHHRVGNTCLGTAASQIITMKTDKELKKDVKKAKRYFTSDGRKGSRAKQEEEDEKVLTMIDIDVSAVISKPNKMCQKSLEDFVPLSKVTNNSDTSSGNGHCPSLPAPQGTIPTENQSQSLKRKTEEFNKNLMRNPSDIELWLQFIQFQEELFKEGGDLGIGKSHSEIEKLKMQEYLIFQMKEAIFERALKQNPKCIRLKIEQLQFCTGFWDQEKISKEWKDLISANPNNLVLWEKYLKFVQSNISSFKVTKLTKAYRTCLQTLKSIRQKKITSHAEQPGTVDFLTDTFVKLCHILHEAGHTEKALGLFQAQLEFNLFHPASLDDYTEAYKMEFFTAFWESSAAKIGDDDAKGWNDWVANKGNVPSYVPWMTKEADQEIEDDLIIKHSSKWTLWQALEESRETRHWLPWRPDTQKGESHDDCEDPERLILSQDITYAVFSVDTFLQKLTIVQHFLEFLGLLDDTSKLLGPKQVKMLSTEDGYLKDLSVATSTKCLLSMEQFMGNILGQTQPLFKQSHILTCKMALIHMDFIEWTISCNKQNANASQMSIRIKNARLAINTFLSQEAHRNNLLLYRQYSLLEWRLGYLNKARKVIRTVTDVLSKPGTETCLRHLLLRTFAEMELGLIAPNTICPALHDATKSTDQKKMEPDHQKCLAILSSVSDPTLQFRPDSEFLQNCTSSYSQGLDEHFQNLSDVECMDDEKMCYLTLTGTSIEHFAVCYIMFMYMTAGVKATCKLFETVMSKLNEVQQSAMDMGSSISGLPRVPEITSGVSPVLSFPQMVKTMKEHITEAYINLLDHHITVERCPLHVLRTPLKLALKLFPDNLNLLNKFIKLELRSSFTGTLRRDLSRICRQSLSASPWIMTILAEISKIHKIQATADDIKNTYSLVSEMHVTLPEIGLVQIVRNWFDRAAASQACSGSVILWRLYLAFEMTYGKPETVKAVFYRSVQQCPWAKSLYMDYVKKSSSCLEEVVDLMTEKELRVHTLLEEIDILLEPPDDS